MAVAPKGQWLRPLAPNPHITQRIQWFRKSDQRSDGLADTPEMTVHVSHGPDGEPTVLIEQGGHSLEISDVGDFLKQIKAHGTDRIKLEPEVVTSAAIHAGSGLVKLQLRSDGSVTWKGTI